MFISLFITLVINHLLIFKDYVKWLEKNSLTIFKELLLKKDEDL